MFNRNKTKSSDRRRGLHLPHMSLLTRFMIISGLILLFGAVIIGWWINRQIEAQVIDNSLKVTSVFVDSTVAPHLWELGVIDHVSDIQKAHLNRLLQSSIDTGEFVAFHIAEPDGKLIYSNPPLPPGTNMSTEGLEAAVQGRVESHFTNGIDFLPRDPQKSQNLIETYFPVRDVTGTQIIAIASFYQSLDRLRQSILFSQLQGWAVVGICTVLMYILLFGLVKRGSDTIEQQKADLAESREQIQRAAVRAADVNEAFMRRLGSDLHDGPAQDLGIALMRMEPLRAALEKHGNAPGVNPPEPDVVAFDLQLIHTALQSSLQEIRNIAGGLRLPDLDDLDLAAAINKAITDYTRKTGQPVTVNGPGKLAGNMALKSAAYRIVQETLNNGHVHGKATEQSVTFEASDDRLSLAVKDNGRGFDPSVLVEQDSRRHLGLAGLQERAEILGGRLHIESRPGHGATITAELPLDTVISSNLED